MHFLRIRIHDDGGTIVYGGITANGDYDVEMNDVDAYEHGCEPSTMMATPENL